MHSVSWDADTFLDGPLFLYQALLKAHSTAHFITFSPARAHKHACTQTPVQARAHTVRMWNVSISESIHQLLWPVVNLLTLSQSASIHPADVTWKELLILNILFRSKVHVIDCISMNGVTKACIWKSFILTANCSLFHSIRC